MPPTDAFDEACRNHDASYARATRRQHLVEADQVFVDQASAVGWFPGTLAKIAQVANAATAHSQYDLAMPGPPNPPIETPLAPPEPTYTQKLRDFFNMPEALDLDNRVSDDLPDYDQVEPGPTEKRPLWFDDNVRPGYRATMYSDGSTGYEPLPKSPTLLQRISEHFGFHGDASP